ncbi:IS21-like element helper ATPase IstB [Haloechinothrix salitolerans]|uniref:IS21-like element helper ATPase IstB n=1 Tax=Haloechinothrix salitolerans TaxID=926830 RepID=A0ABW2BZK6_9PSEU
MSSTLTGPPAAAVGKIEPGVDTVDAHIEQACRTLCLSTIRAHYEEIAEAALREHASYKAFLLDLLDAECEQRDQRRRIRLVREARFPRPKRVESFDFTANPHVSAEVVNTLTQPGWISAGQPLCLIGDSGTGKSHLLIGIGTAIAEAGRKVRYTTTANLVNELSEAADEHQLGRVLKRYSKIDLLCLDEFCYLELDKTGAKLLFQILTEREERRSIAVASNVPFSEWKATILDQRLCAAVVDRLTYNGHIIETGTDSYRLRTTQQRLADQSDQRR